MGVRAYRVDYIGKDMDGYSCVKAVRNEPSFTNHDGKVWDKLDKLGFFERCQDCAGNGSLSKDQLNKLLKVAKKEKDKDLIEIIEEDITCCEPHGQVDYEIY